MQPKGLTGALTDLPVEHFVEMRDKTALTVGRKRLDWFNQSSSPRAVFLRDMTISQ